MTQPARLSPAEVEERRRDLHRWGLDQPRASVTDIATRRPLGLAPIIDDVRSARARRHWPLNRLPRPAGGGGRACRRLDRALVRGATRRRRHRGGICSSIGIGAALAAVFDGDDAVYERVLEMKAEIAEARGTIRDLGA